MWDWFLSYLQKPIGVALAIIRLCPAKIPNEIQLLTSDTNTNNGIEDVEVCTVDENVEKLKWSEEDSREEQAQAKEQYLIKEPAQLGELSQPQEHGQFENSHTMSLMKSGPEIRESVRNRIKWKRDFVLDKSRSYSTSNCCTCCKDNDTARMEMCSVIMIMAFISSLVPFICMYVIT